MSFEGTFFVRHLHKSQDGQKDDLDPLYLSVYMHDTHAHIGKNQSQHQQSCRERKPVAILSSQGMVSSGKSELSLGGGSSDSPTSSPKAPSGSGL